MYVCSLNKKREQFILSKQLKINKKRIVQGEATIVVCSL